MLFFFSLFYSELDLLTLEFLGCQSISWSSICYRSIGHQPTVYQLLPRPFRRGFHCLSSFPAAALTLTLILDSATVGFGCSVRSDAGEVIPFPKGSCSRRSTVALPPYNSPPPSHCFVRPCNRDHRVFIVNWAAVLFRITPSRRYMWALSPLHLGLLWVRF